MNGDKYFLCSNSTSKNFSTQGEIQVWSTEKKNLIETIYAKDDHGTHGAHVETRTIATLHFLNEERAFVFSPSSDGRYDSPQMGTVDVSRLRTLQSRLDAKNSENKNESSSSGQNLALFSSSRANENSNLQASTEHQAILQRNNL